MIDDVSVQLDRPRGNCRQMRKAENGRPYPEGERYGRHPRNTPRGRYGAAATMRWHRTDHSARPIAARIPGKPRERWSQLPAALALTLSLLSLTRACTNSFHEISLNHQLRIEKSCVFETVPIEVNKSLIATWCDFDYELYSADVVRPCSLIAV